ncbi:hypothetical protein E4U61_006173 [Claviceps capensis]|nr:hypothetical protein E4U61_006173 [Claviceps capensis]
MPGKLVPLIGRPERVVTIAETPAAPVSTTEKEHDWLKKFDCKHIPFSEGQSPEHIHRSGPKEAPLPPVSPGRLLLL